MRKIKTKTRIKWMLGRKFRMTKIEFRYHLAIFKASHLSKKYKIQHSISMLTRRCKGRMHRCNGGWAYLKHSNCAYENELSNYNYCCKDCHEEMDVYYQELWDDYNSGRL